MTFHPLMIKVTAEITEHLPKSPTVCELGNQTFDPGEEMLPLVMDYFKGKDSATDLGEIQRLQKMDVEEAMPHTGSYFKALGYESYTAIDVNSKYGSLVMDLNQEIQTAYDYKDTFDLVTNNGTGEHIFNQYTVFKNMHDLTKVGGIQLIVLPFYNWINHGFFNFNPLLFTDLAAANDYEIVRLSIASNLGAELQAQAPGYPGRQISVDWDAEDMNLAIEEFEDRGGIRPVTPRYAAWWLKETLIGRKPEGQQSRLPAAISAIAQKDTNISVVAALRKRHDAPFKTPLQGMYAGGNVETDELQDRYSD